MTTSTPWYLLFFLFFGTWKFGSIDSSHDKSEAHQPLHAWAGGERSDAVRTDPVLLDDNGHVFWRLKGYKDEPDILLQDMGTQDLVSVDEKWFAYNAEQKDGIEKYISSLRMKSLRVQKVAAIPSPDKLVA